MRAPFLAFTIVPINLLFCTTVSAHHTTRKSLNFRPPLIADFHTNRSPILDSRGPFQTAHAFLRRLAYPDDSYYIRKDSYTDENTGISHIHVRQVLDGLEVADGNINLNIRDGQVLSYGNSFFVGSAESSLLFVPNWHQAIYCSELSTSLQDPACGSVLDRLQTIASFHSFHHGVYRHDPRAAAFFFLQVAHPDLTHLALTFSSFEAKRHECAVPLEGDVYCKEWLVTSLLDELQPIRARQVYVQTPGANGSTHLNLAWRLEMSLPENHYVAYVSVHDPSKLISLADLVVDAPAPDSDGLMSTLERYIYNQLEETLQSPEQVPANIYPKVALASPVPIDGTYRVWKWGINDPDGGNRTLEAAPMNRKASPLGWHSVPAEKGPLKPLPDVGNDTIISYVTTIGNNVIAQENWEGGAKWKTNIRPDGGSSLAFDFPYGADPSEPGWGNVEPGEYINASITQLSYVANMYHDLLYLYGFDEVSGNFQQHNFGKGGAEGDAIILNAQDGNMTSTASFTITTDGQKPWCRMYLWDTTNPLRDGGLDAGILIHELSHGLSGRLTGGSGNSECLSSYASRGLGEGWSDFIAIAVRSTSAYKDYPIGAWAYNNSSGARHFSYSTNNVTNPLLYGCLQTIRPNDSHFVGEIWAEALYVVSNKLIDKYGFAESLFPSSESDSYWFSARKDGTLAKVPKHGNTLMLQLIVNGMKLQPCNPTFIQARDAILTADVALTGGKNKCTLWNAFASRGLGTNAKELLFPFPPNLNGFEVPSVCRQE